MSNFRDFINSQNAQVIKNAPSLPIARITATASVFNFFTNDAPMIKLHYHEQEGYFICPEGDCPACIVDKPSRETFLFPVVNLIRKRIEILRVPCVESPGSLFTLVAAVLSDPTQANKAVQVSKSGDYHYIAKVSPNSPSVETQELISTLVQQFSAERAAGTINLEALFPRRSVVEVREIPSIRKMLKICGLLDDEDAADDSVDILEAV